MLISILILSVMLIAAVWTVMRGNLLRATISLAFTSAALSLFMFRIDAPIAGAFELSVCAGLITVVFISIISLTKPLTNKEITFMTRERFKRFWFLPVILLAIGAIFFFGDFTIMNPVRSAATGAGLQDIIWKDRQIDILGQVIILLVGVFGVIVLFKERKKDE